MTRVPASVQDGLAGLIHTLKDAGVVRPEREARLILAHVLGIDPGRMTLHIQDPLGAEDLEAAYRLCRRRAQGEPLSHIRGYRDFWGREFFVDDRVLDPRPETECLVAEALREPFSKLLDLGTGSGCILVTLLAEGADAVGHGVDITNPALDVARTNATRHGVDTRCSLGLSDWFDTVVGTFDLIVSNPPYISLKGMDDLHPGVTGFEPRVALTDEGDGLGAYRAIAAGAPEHLTPGGRLLVEIGPTQGAAVSSLFSAAGLEDVRVCPDLDGRDRVVAARAKRRQTCP